MARLVCLTLSLLIAFLNPSGCFAEADHLPQAQVSIEEGTPVRVKLGEAISTKTSAAGEKLVLNVVEDVLAKDGKTVVIPEGRSAIGFLTNVDEKDGGKGGRLSIEITSVKALDGTKILLRGARAKSGKDGAGVGSYVVGGLLLGVVGLGVVALAKRSSNAKMPAGTILTAYVNQDTLVAVAPAVNDKVAKELVAANDSPAHSEVHIVGKSSTTRTDAKAINAHENER
jgi:hypothetical protein